MDKHLKCKNGHTTKGEPGMMCPECGQVMKPTEILKQPHSKPSIPRKPNRRKDGGKRFSK